MKSRAHIGRFAGADRKARCQLGIGADGEGHGDGGEHERPRRIAAGVAGDRADQHINAGADGDADAVEHQQRQIEAAAQGRRRNGAIMNHMAILAGASRRRLARGQRSGLAGAA